jgi:hypothetical protein
MQGSARPDERIYPYTVDFWINALTSGIALDASEVRGAAPLLSVVIRPITMAGTWGSAVRSVLDQGVEALKSWWWTMLRRTTRNRSWHSFRLTRVRCATDEISGPATVLRMAFGSPKANTSFYSWPTIT